MVWWLLGASALVLLWWGCGSTRAILAPAPFDLTPPNPLPPFTAAPLTARDGAPFDVWVLAPPAARGRLLLFHGYYANRYQVLSVAHGLRERGYEVMLIELRGHGSRPPPCTLGARESDDAEVALAWAAAQRSPSRLPLGVLGLSMGGVVACRVAARHPEVRAVVLDSVYARFYPVLAQAIWRERHLPPVPCAWVTWLGLSLALGRRLGRLDPCVLAPRLTQPLLAIQGGADRRVSLAAFEAWYGRWAGPKERWVEPDVAHIGMYSRHPAQYLERVGGFLDRRLRSA